MAQTGPAAPQAPTVDVGGGPGVALVAPGQSLFIDPVRTGNAVGPCRQITNADSKIQALPYANIADWLSAISPTHPPTADMYSAGQTASAVCCRPATVTLCNGAAGGTEQATITGAGTDNAGTTGYGVYGATGTAAATCTDQWGLPYTETATFTCGSNGVAEPNTDGQWQGGTLSYGCSANAYTSACSASCPTTTGTTTTYDSCGNATATNSCSISCCTNNWQISSTGACQGTCGGNAGTQSVTYTNYGTCGGSNTTSQGCTTGPCCTPVYSYACSGSSYVATDTTCNTGSSTVGTCTWTTTTTQYFCSLGSFNDCIPNGLPGMTCYSDCTSWPAMSGSCTSDACQWEEYYVWTTSGTTYGHTCAVISQTCTSSYWAPP